MLRGCCLAAFIATGACAGPMIKAGGGPTFQALGHDPAWTLTLRDGRIMFAAADPKTLIEIPTPLPQAVPGGQRYDTDRLTLEIIASPCNDAKSGIGFSETVSVTLDGREHRGCGGKRVPLLNV